MPRVSIVSADDAPLVAAPNGTSGSVTTRAIFAGDRDPIHLYLHHLNPGASMCFWGSSTDCLLYVWGGAADAHGARLAPRSSAIVEYGASLTVSAGDAGGGILEFRVKDRNANDRAGGHVHLLPSERVPRVEINEGKRVGMALHADSRCPTCRLWLHENDYPDADVETEVHSHSEDEVIFVRAGSIRLGNRFYGPGSALAIAANTKYGFFSGREGLSLVNFRGASATYTSADGTVVLDEAELWRARVKPPEYLTVTAQTPRSEHGNSAV